MLGLYAKSIFAAYGKLGTKSCFFLHIDDSIGLIMKAIIKKIVTTINHRMPKCNLRRFLKDNKQVFLDIGPGYEKSKTGWLTIDTTRHCDIYWDVRKGLPLPTASVAKIYSSHFLEHLTYKEGQDFLKECYRVLSPGGEISICVPNAAIYIQAYVNADIDKNRFLRFKPAYNKTTKIDYVNYMAYLAGHHKYMFDEENLIYILKEKFFKNVHSRSFDPDRDIKSRDFESIYVDGIK
jgi:predicted SAM-dependent methyltransferase